MSWNRTAENDNMVCDGTSCPRPSIVYSERTRLRTAMIARQQGWVVLEEDTLGGRHMSLHLCLTVPRSLVRPRSSASKAKSPYLNESMNPFAVPRVEILERHVD